jgi:hypothetical protein
MFDIPVKIEGIERRRRSVGLFHILAGLFLAANASLAYKYLNYNSFWLLIPVYILAVFSLLYGFFRKRIDAAYKYNRLFRLLQFLTFFALAVFELGSETAIRSISLFLWAGICLALLFAERLIFGQPAVRISNEGIIAPGSISNKRIDWNELESVVVRQDYITLNYSNNQYLQFEIQKVLTGTEIERINLFCSQQLGKAESEKERITGN